jgi:hypothetical protein
MTRDLSFFGSVCFALISAECTHPTSVPTGLFGAQFLRLLFGSDHNREPGCVFVVRPDQQRKEQPARTQEHEQIRARV